MGYSRMFRPIAPGWKWGSCGLKGGNTAITATLGDEVMNESEYDYEHQRPPCTMPS